MLKAFKAELATLDDITNTIDDVASILDDVINTLGDVTDIHRNALTAANGC